MATGQLLLRLPEDLLARFRRSVPNRERSAYVQHLLEQALPEADDDTDPLYLTALEVKKDQALDVEMADWARECIADGLADLPGFKPRD